MIENTTELRVAIRGLRIMEKVLAGLQSEMEAADPQFFQLVAKAYQGRIASLQSDIAAYLAAHPTEVSLVLPPLEQALAAVAPPAPSTP